MAVAPPKLSVIVFAALPEVVALAGEDAMPTGLLEMLDALPSLESVVPVKVATTDVVVMVAVTEASTEEGEIVVTETPDSVAILERKLDASDALKVNVSDGREVANTVDVTVTTCAVLVAPVAVAETSIVDEVSDVAVEWCALCVCVEDAAVEDIVLLLLTGSLSSSSLQSKGRSTVLDVLLAKMPPVAPEALMIAAAVALDVQDRT